MDRGFLLRTPRLPRAGLHLCRGEVMLERLVTNRNNKWPKIHHGPLLVQQDTQLDTRWLLGVSAFSVVLASPKDLSFKHSCCRREPKQQQWGQAKPHPPIPASWPALAGWAWVTGTQRASSRPPKTLRYKIGFLKFTKLEASSWRSGSVKNK